tara:strand:- start:61533 stop:62270 length:738 start_codon:yes stop_codon:yes gene_type:complete
MITNSFNFLERIRDESRIWQQGISNWDEFIKIGKVNGISSQKKYQYNRKIHEAKIALDRDNLSYFKGKLPQVEMWKFFALYKEDCCYLDIEADASGKITVIGISNYFETNFFVKGVNLDRKLLLLELSKYKIIITFNGGAFDLPKIKRELEIIPNQLHIDLKPLCVNLGLKGGLKEVEKQLNIERPQHCKGNPIDLWKTFHASGDREYLDLLLEYNGEDCYNLKLVMGYVYKELSEDLKSKIMLK